MKDDVRALLIRGTIRARAVELLAEVEEQLADVGMRKWIRVSNELDHVVIVRDEEARIRDVDQPLLFSRHTPRHRRWHVARGESSW